MTAAPPLDIRHNAAERRFEARVAGGLARVDYERHGRVLRIDRTEVPREAQGRGVAGALIAATLAYAESNRLEVQPSCPYARRYFDVHPEMVHLLARGMG